MHSDDIWYVLFRKTTKCNERYSWLTCLNKLIHLSFRCTMQSNKVVGGDDDAGLMSFTSNGTCNSCWSHLRHSAIVCAAANYSYNYSQHHWWIIVSNSSCSFLFTHRKRCSDIGPCICIVMHSECSIRSSQDAVTSSTVRWFIFCVIANKYLLIHPMMSDVFIRCNCRD